MKWIKQSFAFGRRHPRESLILAVISLAALYASSLLHVFGALLTSLVFVACQGVLFPVVSATAEGPLILPWNQLREQKAPLLITALFLAPTNVMLGSVIGLFQGSSSPALAAVMILIFSGFCGLAYLMAAHTVGGVMLKKLAFLPALEAALAGFKKHRAACLQLGLLTTLLLLASLATLGLGLIISLPLLLYAYCFSYRETLSEPAAPPSET